jgi:hypothetical protein
MKNLLWVFLLFPFAVAGQVNIAWEQPTRGDAIAVDASNNVYTVDYEYALGAEITLTKRDADGNFIWVASYNQTDNTKWERASWVAVDNNGNIIVTGTYMSGYSNPVEAASIVMKFNSSGTLLWRNVYENSFDGSSTKKCLVDANNNIYVLGIGYDGISGFRTKVKKFQPNGTTIWTYFDPVGIGAPLNFKFTPDNHIVIVGRGITGSVNGYAKIDLNGNHIWDLAPVFSLTTGDAAGDAFGNTYLVHTEYISNGTTQIKKLDATGNIIWDNIYGMAGNRIEVGTDNQAVISGYPNVNSFGAAFMKVDEGGNELWSNLDADGPQGLFLHALLLLDEYNNGYLAAGTLFNMAVCKVNHDGTSAWTALTSNGGYAFSMVLGKNLNSVFVVGGITARLDDETAPMVCDPPASVTFSNITTTSIKVNWSDVPEALQYEVWRKKSSGNNWKIQFVPGDKNAKNYKNLTCNTSFDFKIRSICDEAGTVVSEFSPVYTASTAACKMEDQPVIQDQLSVYPNPASDYLTVDLILPDDFMNGKVDLMDVNGRILASQVINDPNVESISLDVRSLPSGMYLLRVTDGQHIITRQVVIN